MLTSMDLKELIYLWVVMESERREKLSTEAEKGLKLPG